MLSNTETSISTLTGIAWIDCLWILEADSEIDIQE